MNYADWRRRKIKEKLPIYTMMVLAGVFLIWDWRILAGLFFLKWGDNIMQRQLRDTAGEDGILNWMSDFLNKPRKQKDAEE